MLLVLLSVCPVYPCLFFIQQPLQETVAVLLAISSSYDPSHQQLLKCVNNYCPIVKAKCEIVHPAIIPLQYKLPSCGKLCCWKTHLNIFQVCSNCVKCHLNPTGIKSLWYYIISYKDSCISKVQKYHMNIPPLLCR